MNIRKIIIYGIGALLVVFTLFSIKWYLFDGRLIVNAPAGAQISLSQASGSDFKLIGKSNASPRLTPGQYIIRIQKGDSETRTSAMVIKRQTITLSLDFQPVKPARVAVADVSANKINVNPDGSIIFLASSFHQLFISSPHSQNKTPYLSDIYPVAQVDWLDSGMVISTGTGFSSYIDSSGSRHDMGINLSIQGSGYDVSSGGQIAYLSPQGKLMFMSSPAAAPVSLPAVIANGGYTVKLSSDGRYVFLYSSINEVDSSKKTVLNNYIINTSSPSRPLSFTSAQEIDGASWSPDDKVMAYAAGAGLSLVDVGTGKQKTVYTSPHPLPVWLLGFIDGSHLLYAQDSAIWKLDTASLASYKLSPYQGSLTASSFYRYPGDGIFYSTQTDEKGLGGNIYQINL